MDAPPVQYVTTSDGYNIAYTVCGQGRPYVFMPSLANHVQLGWHSATQSDWLQGLKDRFTLVCYDHRGQGMSTRGLPSDFVLSDFLRDLEAVVDHLGLKSFLLDGLRVLGHVAIQYAVAHPERIDALILKQCSVLASWSIGLQEAARQNWEGFNVLVAGLLQGDRDATLEYLLKANSQQDWLTKTKGIGVSDISEFLPHLDAPTLLLEGSTRASRDPLDREGGAKLAAGIREARLVITEGPFIGIDATQGIRAIDAFLQGLPPRSTTSTEARGLSARDLDSSRPSSVTTLSAREVDVLRLIAAGRTNLQIAEELVISRSTVQNHVSSILNKAGVANRAEAVAYAMRNGLS